MLLYKVKRKKHTIIEKSIKMPTGGRGAIVYACAGLTNQLLSCWVDPGIAWKKHLQQLLATGGRWWGTPRPVVLTGAKKSHLGRLIRFELPMGFQNFVVINKIHRLKKKIVSMHWLPFEIFHFDCPGSSVLCII